MRYHNLNGNKDLLWRTRTVNYKSYHTFPSRGLIKHLKVIYGPAALEIESSISMKIYYLNGEIICIRGRDEIFFALKETVPQVNKRTREERFLRWKESIQKIRGSSSPQAAASSRQPQAGFDLSKLESTILSLHFTECSTGGKF